MSKEKKLTWYDVKLSQFKELQQLLDIKDETDRILAISELILGKDVTSLPIKEFHEEIKKLSFLKEEIPSSVPPKKLTVNGKNYIMDCLLGNITTAQYIDYVNHYDTGDMAKMLSVFVIPEGHKYNDGYDMTEVIKDINDLPIPVVNSAAFFFSKHFSIFMRTFQSYSIDSIKKTDMPKEAKKHMIEAVRKSVDLALYPLS